MKIMKVKQCNWAIKEPPNYENNNIFKPLNGGIIRLLKQQSMMKITIQSMD